MDKVAGAVASEAGSVAQGGAPSASSTDSPEDMQVEPLFEYYPGDSPAALLTRMNDLQPWLASLRSDQEHVIKEQDEKFTREDAQIVWDRTYDRVLGLEKISDNDVGFLLETFPQKVVYTLSRANTVRLLGILQVSTDTRLDSLKLWCMEHRNTTDDWSQRVRRTVAIPSILPNNP